MDPSAWFSRGEKPPKLKRFSFSEESKISREKKFYTEDRYERLVEKRKIYETDLFKNVSTLVDPFSDVNQVFILDKGGLVMSNIDAIFDITRSRTDFSSKRTEDNIKFIDIEGIPGSSVQYIQYRFMKSEGFGFAKRRGYKGSIGWNEIVDARVVNNSNFNTSIMGIEMNGDVEVEYSYFKDAVLLLYPNGVQLCSCHSYSFQGVLLCLDSIEIKRDIIVKLDDTISYEMVSLIYSISLLFNEIYLIRLVSMNKFSGEKYLICKERKVGEFKKAELSEKFVEWITEINDLHIDDELFYIAEVNRAIKEGKRYKHRYVYDLLKINTMFMLPDVNRLIGFESVYR
uniref:FtsJ-like methyltransferase n=1 Tax=Pithovirus LCPAC403 TaxID=2506596 RepID=A0A481ZB34_9VIRU|nr:MAG: FtsJ-like methyltransferase [Pithovirus LCPAC403]